MLRPLIGSVLPGLIPVVSLLLTRCGIESRGGGGIICPVRTQGYVCRNRNLPQMHFHNQPRDIGCAILRGIFLVGINFTCVGSQEKYQL
jgi:hypothetical protein